MKLGLVPLTENGWYRAGKIIAEENLYISGVQRGLLWIIFSGGYCLVPSGTKNPSLHAAEVIKAATLCGRPAF
jgi:hypothetical protein